MTIGPLEVGSPPPAYILLQFGAKHRLKWQPQNGCAWSGNTLQLLEKVTLLSLQNVGVLLPTSLCHLH